MKYSYVMMGNREIDIIRFLSLAKSIRDSGSSYDIIFLHFDNNFNPYKYLQYFDNLKLTYKFVTNPIDLNQIKGNGYKQIIRDIEWDFIKLIPWTLTDYNLVLFMDTDMLVLQNIDHLFDLNYDFIYTSGRISPLNSGIFICRPNLSTYYGLQHFIYSGNFISSNGWFGMGRKRKHYAIEVCQGIFYYYFVLSNQFQTYYLSSQIYNNMSPQCYNSVSEDQIKVVHFTSWGKPPLDNTKITTNQFQQKIHEKWTKNLINLGII